MDLAANQKDPAILMQEKNSEIYIYVCVCISTYMCRVYAYTYLSICRINLAC